MRTFVQHFWQGLVAWMRDLRTTEAFPPEAWGIVRRRIDRYDLTRAFFTRWFLALAMMGIGLAAPGEHWMWLLWLLPAFLQGPLEILGWKHDRAHTAPRRRWSPVTWVVHTTERAKDRMPFNFTGILGGIAAPASIIAVTLGVSTDAVLLKPTALALACLYTVSGTSSWLLDTPFYQMARLSAHLRHTFAPIAATTLVLGFQVLVVLDGWPIRLLHNETWPPELVPLVYGISLVPLAFGLRIHDHDRLVRAAADRIAMAQAAERATLVTEGGWQRVEDAEAALREALDTEGVEDSRVAHSAHELFDALKGVREWAAPTQGEDARRAVSVKKQLDQCADRQGFSAKTTVSLDRLAEPDRDSVVRVAIEVLRIIRVKRDSPRSSMTILLGNRGGKRLILTFTADRDFAPPKFSEAVFSALDGRLDPRSLPEATAAPEGDGKSVQVSWLTDAAMR